MTIALRDALICEPVRCPVGRFLGSLSEFEAHELGALVVRSLLQRTGLAPGDVDDVIFGNVYPSSEAPAIGRVVALDAGLPVEVPGIQIDRRCGSGLQAVIYAAMQVQTGASDVVIAGGAESMSRATHYTTEARSGRRGGAVTLHDSLERGRTTAGGKNFLVPGGMLETAENLRREYGISRAEQDAFAMESHLRAVSAQRRGAFTDEIVPIDIQTRAGVTTFDTDEGPRDNVTMESLGRLRPVLLGDDPDATVTAGSASTQNDGASACIVTHAAEAARLGLRPVVRLVSWASAGVPPRTMGIGPVPATTRALDRAGLDLSDIDLIEINEAFAAQVLACTREWKFTDSDFERTNVLGSGISLGHPVGATGGRILATLTHEMQRRDARYGLETMCIGGGQGLAAVFEGVWR